MFGKHLVAASRTIRPFLFPLISLSHSTALSLALCDLLLCVWKSRPCWCCLKANFHNMVARRECLIQYGSSNGMDSHAWSPGNLDSVFIKHQTLYSTWLAHALLGNIIFLNLLDTGNNEMSCWKIKEQCRTSSQTIGKGTYVLVVSSCRGGIHLCF